jgi:hypothetical protein
MASAETHDLRDAIAAVVREQVIAERREWRRGRRRDHVNRIGVPVKHPMWVEREPETRPYAP